VANHYLRTDIVLLVVAPSRSVLSILVAADYRGWNGLLWRFYLATTPRFLRSPASPGFQRLMFALFAVAFAALTVFVAIVVISRA
jgi:hypothetical protein